MYSIEENNDIYIIDTLDKINDKLSCYCFINKNIDELYNWSRNYFETYIKIKEFISNQSLINLVEYNNVS